MRQRATQRRWLSTAVVSLLVALACTGCLSADVATLASDDMGGRATGAAGGVRAREFLVDQLSAVASGANTTRSGRERYLQRFGTNQANIVAVIPGTDRAGEYVAVGAHYDHLGSNCRTADPADHICNGATDNAAGVAAVLDLARTLSAHPARRSILITFWDGEEQGIVGSTFYVAHPLVPLAKTITAVNADILGANLLPTLRTTTFAIGAEIGGPRLRAALDAATGPSPLDVVPLSLVLGEGRSDHAPFAGAKVPIVFFGDSGGGCYHTAQDDTRVLDQGKLAEQTQTMTRLVRSLADTATPPTFDAAAPVATYDDVVAFTGQVVDRSWPDRNRFSTADQEALTINRTTLHRIVDRGATVFGPDDVSTFLTTALSSSRIVAHLPCDGFLAH